MKKRTSMYLSIETLEKLENMRHNAKLRSISKVIERLIAGNGNNCSECPVLGSVGIVPGTILFDKVMSIVIKKRSNKNARRTR